MSDDIYQRAVRRFGDDAQLRMLAEECCELGAEVNRFFRDRTSLDALAEECADVEIMLAQARIIVGEERIEDAKRRKLWRLASRLDTERAGR